MAQTAPERASLPQRGQVSSRLEGTADAASTDNSFTEEIRNACLPQKK